MSAAETVEIAIFPIPNQVHFPLGVVPLHVFEPRYRQMIKESVQAKRRVAVTHVKRMISDGPAHQDLEQALQSNQGSYEPESIFSAGFCEIQEVTSDGRMMIEIAMDSRYNLIDYSQEIPYRIARCVPFVDQKSSAEDLEKTQLYRDKIDQFLIRNSGKGEHSVADIIESEPWKTLDHDEYSFTLFSFLQFDADIQQEILEMDQPGKRLEFACRVLSLI